MFTSEMISEAVSVDAANFVFYQSFEVGVFFRHFIDSNWMDTAVHNFSMRSLNSS